MAESTRFLKHCSWLHLNLRHRFLFCFANYRKANKNGAKRYRISVYNYTACAISSIVSLILTLKYSYNYFEKWCRYLVWLDVIVYGQNVYKAWGRQCVESQPAQNFINLRYDCSSSSITTLHSHMHNIALRILLFITVPYIYQHLTQVLCYLNPICLLLTVREIF